MRALLPLLLAAAQGSREDSTALVETNYGSQRTGRCLAVFHTKYGFGGATYLAALPEAGRCYDEQDLFPNRRQRMASGFFWAEAGCRLRIWHHRRCYHNTGFDMDARDKDEPLTWIISDIGRKRLLPIHGTPYFGSARCECGGGGGGDEEEEEDEDDDMEEEAAEDDGMEEEAAEEQEEQEDDGSDIFDDFHEQGPVELKEEEQPVSLASEATGWSHRRRAFFRKGHATCSYLWQRDLLYSPHWYGQLDQNECQTLSKANQLLQSGGYAFVEDGCRIEFYKRARCRGGRRQKWDFSPGGRPIVSGVARLERDFGNWEDSIKSVKCRCWW